MIPYLSKQPDVFDPDTIRILSGALDDAWRRVLASGAQFDGQDGAARTVLAKHIVDMAKQGERNHESLVENALIRFRL
jgi:hypothetical protein